MVAVREARPDDVEAIGAVHVASIRGLAASHYDPDQVGSWSDAAEASYSLPAEGSHVVVAEAAGAGAADAEGAGAGVDGGTTDDAVVGFGAVDLETGEVRAVYVHPEHGRSGVGSAILRELEEQARAEDIEELHLTASLNAVQFYEHHGFESTGPATHELANGVELEARAMEKSLTER